MNIENALNNLPPLVGLDSAQLAEKVVHCMKRSIELQKPININILR